MDRGSKAVVAAIPKKFTPEEAARGIDEKSRRLASLTQIAIETESDFRKYISTLRALSGLRREAFDPKKIEVEDVIPPGAMGDSNTINQLQNYVVGVAAEGLTLNGNKELDLDRSFARVNYFELPP